MYKVGTIVAVLVVLVSIGAIGTWARAQTTVTTFQEQRAALDCGGTEIAGAIFEIDPRSERGPSTPKDAFDALLAHIERTGDGFQPSDFEVDQIDGKEGALYVLKKRASGDAVMVVRVPDFGPWWSVDAFALCEDIA